MQTIHENGCVDSKFAVPIESLSLFQAYDLGRFLRATILEEGVFATWRVCPPSVNPLVIRYLKHVASLQFLGHFPLKWALLFSTYYLGQSFRLHKVSENWTSGAQNFLTSDWTGSLLSYSTLRIWGAIFLLLGQPKTCLRRTLDMSIKRHTYPTSRRYSKLIFADSPPPTPNHPTSSSNIPSPHYHR